MTRTTYDTVVIGGGLVGLATARALLLRGFENVAVAEAEPQPGLHQSGHNSGVIHSGLYYRPGSLKARTCVAGRNALLDYCRDKGIPFELCGKLVVAIRDDQLQALDELESRGRANGLEGIERVDARGVQGIEPHARGVAGLRIPETGIVDYREVVRALAADVEALGGQLLLGARLVSTAVEGSRRFLSTTAGEVHTRHVVNCAGLHSDRVAGLFGIRPDVQIIPFRGEYYRLAADRSKLVRNLIYPVPDPRLPFLGVHFTRRISGEVEAGPNAVLALGRHGYRKGSFSVRDSAQTFRFGGFWKMAARYWRTGIAEVRRSYSRSAFVAALAELIPEIRVQDVEPHGSGVRAQAVDRNGKLLDDFEVIERPGEIHVLNAPSPAATACLAIADSIADRASAWRS